jgi:hypothetical protein
MQNQHKEFPNSTQTNKEKLHDEIERLQSFFEKKPNPIQAQCAALMLWNFNDEYKIPGLCESLGDIVFALSLEMVKEDIDYLRNINHGHIQTLLTVQTFLLRLLRAPIMN